MCTLDDILDEGSKFQYSMFISFPQFIYCSHDEVYFPKFILSAVFGTFDSRAHVVLVCCSSGAIFSSARLPICWYSSDQNPRETRKYAIKELYSLPTVATWTLRYLESVREQRNSGWSRSGHTPIKRISEHSGTISCHSSHLLRWFKQFNQHERPKLSQNRSLKVCWHTGNWQPLRHSSPKNNASVMTESFKKKGKWHHQS